MSASRTVRRPSTRRRPLRRAAAPAVLLLAAPLLPACALFGSDSGWQQALALAGDDTTTLIYVDHAAARERADLVDDEFPLPEEDGGPAVGDAMRDEPMIAPLEPSSGLPVTQRLLESRALLWSDVQWSAQAFGEESRVGLIGTDGLDVDAFTEVLDGEGYAEEDESGHRLFVAADGEPPASVASFLLLDDGVIAVGQRGALEAVAAVQDGDRDSLGDVDDGVLDGPDDPASAIVQRETGGCETARADLTFDDDDAGSATIRQRMGSREQASEATARLEVGVDDDRSPTGVPLPVVFDVDADDISVRADGAEVEATVDGASPRTFLGAMQRATLFRCATAD